MRNVRTLSLTGLVLALALGATGAALLAAGPAAATDKATAKITVTMTEFKFKLSKTSVSAGTTVTFTVKNHGKIGHNFKVNGKATKLIAPGKSATLKVTFSKKGTFAYLCTVQGHAALGMKGKFAVGVAAVTTPTTTVSTAPTTFPGPGGTVAVSMFEYGFTLNPVSIPSGNVTFVMTNTGTVVHNFDIRGVAGGVGALVDPGMTASMTVNLQAGHTYGFECDVPGHADAGMTGSFTPSPVTSS